MKSVYVLTKFASIVVQGRLTIASTRDECRLSSLESTCDNETIHSRNCEDDVAFSLAFLGLN